VTLEAYQAAVISVKEDRERLAAIESAQPVVVTHPQDHARPWSEVACREFDAARGKKDKAEAELRQARRELADAESARVRLAVAIADKAAEGHQ